MGYSTPLAHLICLQEWLTGGYDEAHGYPTPSVRVLVDVVDHQAGGANPALAKQLAQMTFEDSSSTSGGAEGTFITCSSMVCWLLTRL